MHQDKFGMWHARDISDGSKDNNVFIYGLYAKFLGLDVSKYPEYYKRCAVRVSRDNIIIYRHPRQKEPVLSFDEVIGIVGLQVDPTFYDKLKGNHFVYVGHGERIDSRFFKKLVKALAEYLMPKVIVKGWTVKIKKPNLSDRNRWWRDKLENVAYFAARLTPAHTYIIKKFNNRNYHIEEEKLWSFYRDCIAGKKGDDKQTLSSRNLLWALHLMNGDEKRARDLKPWISFEKYFGASHDFTIAIKKKYGIA